MAADPATVLAVFRKSRLSTTFLQQSEFSILRCSLAPWGDGEFSISLAGLEKEERYGTEGTVSGAVRA
jgi:hypothetical protein